MLCILQCSHYFYTITPYTQGRTILIIFSVSCESFHAIHNLLWNPFHSTTLYLYIVRHSITTPACPLVLFSSAFAFGLLLVFWLLFCILFWTNLCLPGFDICLENKLRSLHLPWSASVSFSEHNKHILMVIDNMKTQRLRLYRMHVRIRHDEILNREENNSK